MRIKKRCIILKVVLLLLVFLNCPLFSTAQVFVPDLSEIDSLRNRSQSFVDKGDFNSAMLRLDSAQAIAKLYQIDSLFSLILLEYVEPLIKTGDFVKAIKNCHQAIEIYDSLKMDNRKGQAFNELGVVYKYSGDIEKAREFYEKAVSIIENTDRKEGLSSALNNYGTILNRTGEYQKAEKITLRAIDLFLGKGDTTGVVSPYFSMAINMDNQKRYDDALEYLNKIHLIAKKYDLIYAMSGYYNGKGIILKHQGNFTAAEKNYLEGLDFAESQKSPHLLKDINNNLSILYREKGDFEKALLYFEKSNVVKDSLFNIEKQKQIETLKETFESAQREKQIELLKKDQSISKLQIRSLSLLALLIALVLGGGVFYQRYRIKKNKEFAEIKEAKLNQELTLKNQQLTSKTLEMVRKNEFLATLSDHLKIAQKEKKIDASVYNQIDKEIGFHHQMEDDWEQFEVAFNEVHKGYIEQLKSNYPELTSNELRHCALLKLGLSLKETANLLGIAPGSVKVSRNRIKKKIKLSAEESLPNFLLSLQISTVN